MRLSQEKYKVQGLERVTHAVFELMPRARKDRQDKVRQGLLRRPQFEEIYALERRRESS